MVAPKTKVAACIECHRADGHLVAVTFHGMGRVISSSRKEG